MNRAERRRQLKDDRRLVERGLDWERTDGAEVIALMRVLHALIEDSRDAGTVAPLMEYFHDNLRAAGRAAPRRAIACKLGCAHCCHAWVSARAPEALFMKRAIPMRDLEAVQASVERTYAVTGTLGVDQRAGMGVPCSLLRGSQCQAYEARPVTCRMAASESAAVCARAFLPGAVGEPIPTFEYYLATRRGYSLALAGALKRGGFPSHSYELNAALRAVLARPDAEAAWLAGEDVFARVPTEPGGDPFESPRNLSLYEAAWAG
jgi:Fe-S-cluster containining protein